ncbi:hypothetical protein [Saccharothrix yanglingensis]|nr:hypothetical protein [Saccharothrix yanglingensis]
MEQPPAAEPDPRPAVRSGLTPHEPALDLPARIDGARRLESRRISDR